MGGRRGITMLCSFFDPLPPNPSCTFQCNGLSSIILYVNGLWLSSHRPPIGHILVTRGAQHQCFALSCYHTFNPCRFFSPAIRLPVFHRSHLMPLHSPSPST